MRADAQYRARDAPNPSPTRLPGKGPGCAYLSPTGKRFYGDALQQQ